MPEVQVSRWLHPLTNQAAMLLELYGFYTSVNHRRHFHPFCSNSKDSTNLARNFYIRRCTVKIIVIEDIDR